MSKKITVDNVKYVHIDTVQFHLAMDEALEEFKQGACNVYGYVMSKLFPEIDAIDNSDVYFALRQRIKSMGYWRMYSAPSFRGQRRLRELNVPVQSIGAAAAMLAQYNSAFAK